MGQVWEDLRRERERRAVSLAAIGARSKIPERHLTALEEGRLLDLPGGVFRRGIVRGYLQALELPAEPWMKRWDACLAELPLPGGAAEGVAVFAESVWRSRSASGVARRDDLWRWPGVLAMVVALLLAGWCVWRYALRGTVVVSTTGHSSPGLQGERSGGRS